MYHNKDLHRNSRNRWAKAFASGLPSLIKRRISPIMKILFLDVVTIDKPLAALDEAPKVVEENFPIGGEFY